MACKSQMGFGLGKHSPKSMNFLLWSFTASHVILTVQIIQNTSDFGRNKSEFLNPQPSLDLSKTKYLNFNVSTTQFSQSENNHVLLHVIFLHWHLYFLVLKFPLFHFSTVAMKHNTLYCWGKGASVLNKHMFWQ